MVRRGEIDAVRAYCEADCLNLFVLYVRWALLSGRTDHKSHNASLTSLIKRLELTTRFLVLVIASCGSYAISRLRLRGNLTAQLGVGLGWPN